MAELPPLFSDAAVAQVPAQVIAEFPEQTFLESVVVTPDQHLYISSLEEGKIYRLTLTGEKVVHAQVPGKAAGLAALPKGGLLLSGWNAAGTPVLSTIAADGTVQSVLELPDAQFLNGITPLTDNLYLIADSYRGAIWQFDVTQNRASLWLEHPLLARSAPTAVFPAVNGLKIFEQVLYVSNTQQQLLVQIPLQDHLQPGQPQIMRRAVNLDDFAFDVAGNLYGTTHVFNSVVKITPAGEVVVIAAAEQGMAGTTALAFGHGEHLTHAYVVTNGGMSFPPPTGLETAKVVQLEIGQEGYL